LLFNRKLGCKNEGKGQCYNDGDQIRKKCNVFECNGDTSRMEPVKMGKSFVELIIYHLFSKLRLR